MAVSTSALNGAVDSAGRRIVTLVVLLAFAASLLVAMPTIAQAACSGNAIVCENEKPGTPASEWDIRGSGDASIQGFATKMSVNAGSPIQFKVDTDATAYTIKIYRLGYYQGNGARLVDTITPSATLPQSQPNCLTDSATEIVDCGNWAVSASWSVPTNAVSGIYLARLIRTDTGGDSHIVFIVRNDGNTSDIVFQTSDTTWQAYNAYGGPNFYYGPNGRATKLSYNRPFATRGDLEGRDFVFSNEYPMLRFLEQNGYSVSYVSGLDVSVDPTLLTKHKTLVTAGHDEYWTKEQRKNVFDARNAGVNMAFFTGNDMYWKSRWEPSQDGTNTPNRTLVTYKDTWAGTRIDPVEPTSTWRDPRFGDLGYGFGPENELVGTLFQANSVDLAIKVNSTEGKYRLWRNTSLASLANGSTATLADHTIGYESNEDLDNGYRPAGLIRLSTTTGPVAEYLQDYGTQVAPGTTTHHLTLYRAPSGALVFSAGSVQWAWGLDSNRDGTQQAADPRIRQATANLLADMSALPTTPAADIVPPTKSTDTAAPTVTVTAPTAGSTITQGSYLTVSGTAADAGGKVAGIEVSVDGGSSFHPAEGTTNWTYSGILTGNGANAIQIRATDDSANTQTTPTMVAINSPCPCSIFGVANPRLADAGDGSNLTLGTKFTSSKDGYITGIRFYKSSGNTGTHQGVLYSVNGAELARGTFTNETASGWQIMKFAAPVAITSGTTYIAAYTAPNGHYSADVDYFRLAHNAGVLTAPGGQDVANGVYANGDSFPVSTYQRTNYWVDAMFSEVDDTPNIASLTSPLAGSSSVLTTSTIRAKLSKSASPSSLSVVLQDGDGTPVSGATSYDSSAKTMTFNPTQGLATGTTYTVTVNAEGMAAPAQWQFRTVTPNATANVCPCTLFNESDQPTSGPDPDNDRVQLGMAFTPRATGQISGIRFFKNPENVGTHSVALWNNSGEKLAEALVTDETTAGWQQADFDAPVPVSSGATYIASYVAPQGKYAFTAGGLSDAVTKGPLASVDRGGRYTYGTGAPTSTSNTNYFVDPVFSRGPDVAPTVRSLAPGDGAKSVPVTASIKAEFSTDVSPGSTVITVKRTSDNSPVPGVTGSESEGTRATFVPTGDLAPGTEYSVTISGATSLGGTPMASSYSAEFTTSGAEACPCSLMETTARPLQVDSGDNAAVTVGLRFTSTVNGKIKGLRYYRAAANTGTHIGRLYSADGGELAELTFEDNGTGWQTASFSSPASVTAGTTYVAAYYAPNGHYSADVGGFSQPMVNTPLRSVDSGSVYEYGNEFPNRSYMGTNYYVDVVFDTSHDDAPTVSTTTPANNAAGVALDAQPTATFHEAIAATSLDMKLTDPNGQPVAGQVSYDPTARKATFSAAAPLSTDTKYTASVTASSASGVAMAVAKTWTFTTADNEPPIVTVSTPADEATSIATTSTVSATFAKAINESSLSVSVKAGAQAVTGTTTYNAATRTATFAPATALAGLTDYTVAVTASSADGVAMPSAKTWAFRTLDSAPASVTAVTPSDQAAGVATNSTATATFDKAIDQTSLAFTLKTSAGSTVSGTTSYDSGSRRATFTPASPLSSLTSYSASVSANSTGGIPMAAPKSWGFTTVDTAPPSVTTRTPAQNATGVAAGTKVTAVFDKAITASTLTMSLKTTAGASVAGSTTYDASSRTATFTPAAALTSSTSYTASIEASSAAGAAMSSATIWSFTTAAQTFSLFTTSQTPATANTSNGTAQPTTVGVRFASSRAGKVTAIRYYAASTNSGTTVSLWTASGTRLATATTAQTGTGWRTATFATPVNITAGTTYVASYYAPAGRFPQTNSTFSSAYTAGPLSVAASGSRNRSGNAFPTTTSTANYWVDVLVLI